MPDFARWHWGSGQGLWDVRFLGDLVGAQAAGYGGGSLIYANVHLRAPDAVFERVNEDGAINWPLEYQIDSNESSGNALAPYYDLAAYMLQVKPMPKPFANAMPKGNRLRETAKDLGYTPISLPLAVNFADENMPLDNVMSGSAASSVRKSNAFGREQDVCDMRGSCTLGCARQAKNTLI